MGPPVDRGAVFWDVEGAQQVFAKDPVWLQPPSTTWRPWQGCCTVGLPVGKGAVLLAFRGEQTTALWDRQGSCVEAAPPPPMT